MNRLYVITGILAIVGLALGQNCSPSQWQCENGNCIPATSICDGYDDCKDYSDEGGASGGICPKCPSGFFRCEHGRCRNETWICNGNNNCGDWSDETEIVCPCDEDGYRCRSGSQAAGMCITREQICDGEEDCRYGDDEENCSR